MPTLEACRREVESLHEFFVEWYAATVDRAAFDRLDRALAPGFEMVTPAGRRQDRTAVLDWVREGYGQHEPGTFDIEIRGVESVAALDDRRLVRYEEWQRGPDGRNGRVSTVLMARVPDDDGDDAGGDLRWLDIHETTIEGSSDAGDG